MLIIDNTHKSRALGRLVPALCVSGRELGPHSPRGAGASAAGSMLSGQWGAARGTGPTRVVQPVSGLRVLLFSVKFFPRRKMFQRNTCECLKGREMAAKAKIELYQCSEAVRL